MPTVRGETVLRCAEQMIAAKLSLHRCVVQLYFGLGQPSQGGFSVGVANGLRTMRSSSSADSRFMAPALPGVYYITHAITLDYDYKDDVAHSNDFKDALAVVVVVAP